MNGIPVSRTRRSVDYFVDQAEGRLRRRIERTYGREGHYTWMLEEDATHVLPYGRGLDDGFAIAVVSADTGRDEQADDQLVANALAPGDRYAHLGDAFRDFTDLAVQTLMACGSATYEVDILSKGEGPEPEPFAFEINPLVPGSLARRWLKPVQLVPPDLGEATTLRGTSYRPLDPKTLITVELPRHLRRDLRRAKRVLRDADKRQRTEISLLESWLSSNGPYQPMDHRQQTKAVLARATAATGWDGRGQFTDGQLPPYTVWRRLQFVEFKIALRTVAENALNEALSVAGRHLGRDLAVVISGVVTTGDVAQARTDLALGSRSLADLVYPDMSSMKTDPDQPGEPHHSSATGTDGT